MSVVTRLRAVPKAAWACAAVAFANALVWAIIVPPFQVPDERVHVAYAVHIAAAREIPPRAQAPPTSDRETAAFDAVRFNAVAGDQTSKPPWTAAEDRAIGRALGRSPRTANGGGPTNVTTYPPLYYLAAAGAYAISPSHNFFDRLFAMRLVSAMCAALTVLFVFLFLRELVPRSRWAWVVGALAVAAQPVASFIGGGVNNDNLLALAAAALFFLVARTFRKGLTVHLAVAIGLVFVTGVLAKQSMGGLAPGLAVAAGLLVWRTPAAQRRATLRAVGAGAAALLAPLAAYAVLSAAFLGRSLTGGAEGVASASGQATGSFTGQLAYVWQTYLPRLHFMQDQFPGPGWPALDIWFKPWIGRFGWLDYGFSEEAYAIAAEIAVIVIALVITSLVRNRVTIERRWPELATYVVMFAGQLTLIGLLAYGFQLDTGGRFEQARYLLPLLPLYAAVIVVAAKAAGRRWAPSLGGVLVVAAFAHQLFAQLLTVQRYYA